MSDDDLVEHFARLGFSIEIEELVFTTETVEDFVRARDMFWHRPGDIERYEANGILILSRAQPKAGQPIREIVVLSLGHARVVVGVLPTAAIDPDYPRFAETMG
jgi:hypothetical protein